jgi:hypothetical protein
MSKRLEAAVSGNKTDGYTFTCPVTSGCGDPGSGEGFVSRGWPERKYAIERGREHFREHVTGADPEQTTVVASSLEEFRAKHGLGTDPDDGARAIVLTDKDL